MTYHHTMPRAKIAVTLDEAMLTQVDRLVDDGVYPNRSRAIEAAVREKLSRLEHTRLARECAKLDPRFERRMAEEGISGDLQAWPEY